MTVLPYEDWVSLPAGDSEVLNSESYVDCVSRMFGDSQLMSRELFAGELDHVINLCILHVEFHVPAGRERETAVRMMREMLTRRQA